MVRGVVAVTGATGFIASHIVRKLLSDGYAVRGTVRDLWKAWHLVNMPYADERLTLKTANLREPGSFDEAIKGCDAVIHCASPFFFSKAEDPERQLVEPAVGGTLNVLESCKKVDSVKRVVLTSSIAAIAYKDASADHLFTSEDWSDEEFLREREMWYMLSKTLAEKAAWDFVGKQSAFDMVSINPTLVTGPMLQPVLNSSTNVILNLLKGRKKKIPKTTFQFVDVRDVANAHVNALTTPEASGKRYLTVGGCGPTSDLVEVLERLAPEAHCPTVMEEGEQVECINVDAEPAVKDLKLGSYRSMELSVADTLSELRRSPFYGFESLDA